MSTIESNPLDILSIPDTEIEEVVVPEWGNKVFRVRSISASEREDLLRTSVTVNGKNRTIESPVMRVKIVWLALVDEDGNRIFTKGSQLQQLGMKSAAAIDRIADVALRLAAITDDTKDDDAGDGDDPKSPSSTPTSDSVTS